MQNIFSKVVSNCSRTYEDGFVTAVNSNGSYNVRVGARDFDYEDLLMVQPDRYTKKSVGDAVRIGFVESSSMLPFIFPAVATSPFAEKKVPKNPITGKWDQAWANYYHGGVGSKCIADLSTYPGNECFAYDTDAGTPNLWTVPEGILFRNNGQVWLVHFFNEGSNFKEIRVKLLNLGLTFTIVASLSIPLTNARDKAWGGPSPDSTCFYDSANDLLHILRIPGANDQILGKSYGRIWTVYFLGGVIGFVESTIETDIYTVLDSVNMAGNKMILGNLTHDTISGYQFDPNSLQWVGLWSKSVVSLGTTGVTGYTRTHGGGTTRGQLSNNYSPPWWNNRFYGMIVTNTLDPSNVKAVATKLEEVSFLDSNGNMGNIVLYSRGEFAKTEAIKLESCNALYAASQQLEADFSRTGTKYAWYKPQTPPLPLIPQGAYATTSTQTWLGCLYESFHFNMDMWTPHYVSLMGGKPDPDNFYSNTAYTYELTIPLGVNVGIADPAPGLPMARPNQGDLYHRFFWKGEGGPTLQDSVARCHTKTVVSQDGYRYHASLLPVPVLGPGGPGLGGSGGTVNITQSPLAFVWEEPCDIDWAHPVTNWGRCTQYKTHTEFYNPEFWTAHKDTAKYWGWYPQLCWAWETVLYAISPNGGVVSRIISQRWTGGEWNGNTISQSLPIPENAWQVIHIPLYNQVAWMIDTRVSVSADPKPTVFVLNAHTLETVYRIEADSFMSDGLDTFTTDQVYAGKTWARAGQYKYNLHGKFTINSPQMKVCVGADNKPQLIVGFQLVEKVEPSSGTSGSTITGHQIFSLDPGGISSGVSGGSFRETWTWPNVTEFYSDRDGPRLVAGMMILDDRIVISGNNEANSILRQIL